MSRPINTGDFDEIENVLDPSDTENKDTSEENKTKDEKTRKKFGSNISSFFNIGSKRREKEVNLDILEEEELKSMEKERLEDEYRKNKKDYGDLNEGASIELIEEELPESDTENLSEKNNSTTDELLDNPNISSGILNEINYTEEVLPRNEVLDDSSLLTESKISQIDKIKEILSEKIEGLKSSKVYQDLMLKVTEKTNKIDKDVIILFFNQSLISFLIIGLTAVTAYQVYTIHNIDYNKIIKYYQVEKKIKEEKEKIRLNKEFKELATILKFGINENGATYPYGGYLYAFSNIFPKELSSLNILTFLEGWSSDFQYYDGRNIRIDNELIESFTKQKEDIKGDIKGIEFSLLLNGEKAKINKFLSNLLYNNKIAKSITSISEVKNIKDGTLSVTLTIIFYVSNDK